MIRTTTYRPVPFINRVRIENYKSIAHRDVILGPLTVLLGLNGAGKSNFLDALRFVRDALTRGLGEAIVSRGGLAEVLRRVPEPTDSLSIALEARIPAPDPPGGTSWHARYEVRITHPLVSKQSDLRRWSLREVCEIGPVGQPPRFGSKSRTVL